MSDPASTELNPLKLLIIGSLPPPLGGTSVSLQHLVTTLESQGNIAVELVNTNRIRDSRGFRILEFLTILSQIFHAALRVDCVTLHVSLHALPLIGPPVWLIAHLFKKPFLIRRFGGHHHDELNGLKFLVADKVIRKADCYLAQTKGMVEHARKLGIDKVRWFPTSRPVVEQVSAHSPRPNCRRFLYLSHIRKTKGIREVVDAAKRLDGEAEVDVYGPFYDDLDEQFFVDCSNVNYHGVVPQKEVPQVLCQYDALLLPTYYPGEGYPGIILEAFSAGMPVIATRWKAIPELVDETCGILIEPRSPDALYQAMLKLCRDDDLFRQLSQGASRRHKDFDAQLWTDRFVEYCHLTLQQ